MNAQYLRDEFAVTYLTLISIIQAVMLGLLATMVDSRFGQLHLEQWLKIATSVVIAIVVWNEHRMGATQFAWIPNLVDTVIPFALGIVQCAVFRTSVVSEDSFWFCAVGGIYFAGIAGFENMYRRAAAEGNINTDVLRAIGRWRTANTFICVALMLLFGVFAAASFTIPIVGWARLTMLSVTLALNIAFLIRGEANWRLVVRLARFREPSDVAAT